MHTPSSNHLNKKTCVLSLFTCRKGPDVTGLRHPPAQSAAGREHRQDLQDIAKTAKERGNGTCMPSRGYQKAGHTYSYPNLLFYSVGSYFNYGPLFRCVYSRHGFDSSPLPFDSPSFNLPYLSNTLLSLQLEIAKGVGLPHSLKYL